MTVRSVFVHTAHVIRRHVAVGACGALLLMPLIAASDDGRAEVDPIAWRAISHESSPPQELPAPRGRDRDRERGEGDSATWWERTPHGDSRHYRIKTDLPPDEARELARHLDRVRDAMHNQLGSLPSRRPINNLVLVFQDREDYLYTLRSRYGINAIGTGGVFFVQPRGEGIAVWIGDRPRRRINAVLQHEAFHHFAFSRFGTDLPVWVDEGLAMLFEHAVIVGGRLLLGEAPPRLIDSVRTAIDQNRTLDFRDILTMDSVQWQEAIHEGSAEVQYHQAWAMVHFLIYGENARYRPAFERYLRMINEGMLADRAFREAFETEDFDLIERAWKRYVMDDMSPSAFAAALERIEFLAEGLLELSRRGVFQPNDAEDGDGRSRRRGRAAARRVGPTTMEELQKALINIDFGMTMTVHGVADELSAENSDLFTIPTDEEAAGEGDGRRQRSRRAARGQPEFVLSEPRIRTRSARERAFERENPTPPIIETRNLRPHGLRIQWQRDEETGDLSYEIEVR